MFRSIRNVFTTKFQASTCNVEARRSTFILRRKNRIRLNKLEAEVPRKLKRRDYFYELVEDTDQKKTPMVDLVLIKNVQNVGNSGDIITVRKLIAYDYYILSGAAKLATPENIQKYACLKRDNAVPVEIQKLVGTLQQTHVPVFMHPKNPWTLQPWHISLSLRKLGIICPEKYIKMPEQPISGPDFNIEKKDFLIQVVIDEKHTVNMRCRLFHMVLAEANQQISLKPTFYLDPIKPIFPEEKEVLESIPITNEKKSRGIVILDD